MTPNAEDVLRPRAAEVVEWLEELSVHVPHSVDCPRAPDPSEWARNLPTLDCVCGAEEASERNQTRLTSVIHLLRERDVLAGVLRDKEQFGQESSEYWGEYARGEAAACRDIAQDARTQLAALHQPEDR